MTKVVFAGGGSGGHLYPGIALAEELARRNASTDVLFVGSDRPIEKQIVAGEGYSHVALRVEPLRSLFRNPFRFAWSNWQACRYARMILADERPDVVVGLGGFASFPTVVAAGSLGIPVLLLEQNRIAGRATRWLAGRAALVCASFADTRGRLPRRARLTVTGNPVRREIAELATTSRPKGTNPLNILILGGSQGAAGVNEFVMAAWASLKQSAEGESLLRSVSVVHQTGERDVAAIETAYRRLGLRATVVPFLKDMPARYRAADAVVSRSGATTLAELACAGTPAIVIPFPAAADDHQRANAAAFADAGGAVIVEQIRDPDVVAAQLAGELEVLLTDSTRRETMRAGMRTLARPDAAGRIADILERLADRAGTRRVGDRSGARDEATIARDSSSVRSKTQVSGADDVIDDQ